MKSQRKSKCRAYKLYQLPNRNVSETEFNIWKEEMEAYLGPEADFQQFLPGARFPTWQNQETFAHSLMLS